MSVASVNATIAAVELSAGGALDEASNDATVKITGGVVTLAAVGAIGDNADTTNAPLDITAGTLVATTSAAGVIYIIESDGVTLQNVTSNSGNIRVQSGGAIVATSVTRTARLR